MNEKCKDLMQKYPIVVLIIIVPLLNLLIIEILKRFIYPVLIPILEQSIIPYFIWGVFVYLGIQIAIIIYYGYLTGNQKMATVAGFVIWTTSFSIENMIFTRVLIQFLLLGILGSAAATKKPVYILIALFTIFILFLTPTHDEFMRIVFDL